MRFKTSPGSRSSLSINSARLRPYLQLATTTKPSTADATHLLKLVRQMARTGRWEIFALPFCSRCTPVVVAAVQDILKAATERSEEHTSELQSHLNIVCRLLLVKKKIRPLSAIL